MADAAPPTSSATSTPPAAAAIPAEHVATVKYAVIGGSGVTVKGTEVFSFSTPYGPVSDIGFLDDAKRVLFISRRVAHAPAASCIRAAHARSKWHRHSPLLRGCWCRRHNSTNIAADGKPTYAPPHDVNFHAIIWALRHLNVKGILSIGSTGTLHPKEVRRLCFCSCQLWARQTWRWPPLGRGAWAVTKLGSQAKSRKLPGAVLLKMVLHAGACRLTPDARRLLLCPPEPCHLLAA